MNPDGFSVQASRANAGLHLALAGRVDFENGPVVASHLTALISEDASSASPSKEVIVSLSGVESANSALFSALLRALACAEEHAVALRVGGWSDRLREYALLNGLDQVFLQIGNVSANPEHSLEKNHAAS